MVKSSKTSQQSGNLNNYVLGLDLGPASVGWAVVELNEQYKPIRLVRCGVRRFDAGVAGGSEKISSGRDKPKALARRTARSLRRSTWRKRRRMRSLYLILAKNQLLPETKDCNEARHNALHSLDAELRSSNLGSNSHVDQQILTYLLRSKGLDEKLTPHEMGRAIYHLAQRRGYRSNRKTEASEEDRGDVATGISELADAIRKSNSRTVGEYFSTLNPEEERIRGRWTAREMFIDEFYQIWNKQSEFQPKLYTDELKEKVFATIFEQRPLKSQKHLIGKCDLQPTKRRALLATICVQRFRYLQKINDLEIIAPDGGVSKLSDRQRTQLIEQLETEGDITWATIRRLFKLTTKKTIGYTNEAGKKKPIKKGYTFNFEEGGDKKIVGNRTAAKIRKHIAEIWDKLESAKQAEMADEILSFQSETALANRLQSAWDLDPWQADAVSKTVLEPGYANHSRKAVNNFLPRLEKGDQYAAIRREIYPERFESTAPLEMLPPVQNVAGLDQIKNPVVTRALTELRKVVNAIVRKFGKPTQVRIELARDLKHARKRREQFSEVRDRNQKARAKAAEKIVAETKDETLLRNRSNVLKVRLAEECGWVCPYSGKSINMEKLVVSPQFEIEHIIPYSRSFDNSFANKTLCHIDWNREKSNRTPFEAFSGRDDFEEMLGRVNLFQGGLANRKLALFMREDPLHQEQFTQRMLNDTRYICRKACEYLGLLFGGVNDAEGNQRVQALPGRCTANLRNNWDLNRILGHPAKKERADHRHHAIDAVVIAVTTSSLVKTMSAAAEAAERCNTKMLFEPIKPPWSSFQNDIGDAIASLVVSSRVDKRLNGSLHNDTILSQPMGKNPKGKPVHHVRKPIQALSANEVKAIVDPEIRRIVQKTLDAIKQPPSKAFADPINHPHLIGRKDPTRVIPIHRVRIRKSDKPMAVGKGNRRRYVNPGSNSHMEIVAVLDKDGNERKWEGILVSRFDAMTRKRNGEDVVERNHTPKIFKFSICASEHLQVTDEKNTTTIVRILSISNGDIECINHFDARPAAIRRKDGSRLRFSLSKLMKHRAKKVVITPLGKIIDAND